MKKITVGCTKGGTGKTTIAVNLASVFVARGYRTLLIDADAQASALLWRKARHDNSLPVISMPTPTLHSDIDSVASGFDVVVVDVGGSDSTVLRSAISAADLLLIPFKAGQYDTWAVADTMRIIEEARSFGIDPQVRILLNMVKQHTRIFKDLSEQLADAPVDCLDICIGDRQTFVRSSVYAKPVIEIEPDGKAAQEINALGDEVSEIVGL